MPLYEDSEVKIVSEAEANWIRKKELSGKMVETLEIDLKDIPFLIQFHKAVIEMCEEKIKNEKQDIHKNE